MCAHTHMHTDTHLNDIYPEWLHEKPCKLHFVLVAFQKHLVGSIMQVSNPKQVLLQAQVWILQQQHYSHHWGRGQQHNSKSQTFRPSQSQDQGERHMFYLSPYFYPTGSVSLTQPNIAPFLGLGIPTNLQANPFAVCCQWFMLRRLPVFTAQCSAVEWAVSCYVW